MKEPRILIIDDNKSILEDFVRILSPTDQSSALDKLAMEMGYTEPEEDLLPRFQITTALQGQAGYALVQQSLEDNSPFAVAFVDVRMPPGWDGIETIKKIWSIDNEIQVVICTAFSDYSWEDIIRELGQRDNLLILKKPFDLTVVRQLALALTQKWQTIQDAKNATRTINDLQFLLDNTAQGIYAINNDGLCTYINKSALSILGYTNKNEVLNINMHTLIHHSKEDGSPFPAEECKILQAISQNTVTYVDDELIWRKDGVPCPVECLSSPIAHQGIVEGAVICFNDISRRKRMEEVAQLNEKMNALTKRAGMSDTAASILHNIGNVLTSVNVSLNLLQKNLDNRHLAHAVNMVEIIKANMNNLADYLTKDEKGKLVPAYLAAMFENIISMNSNALLELSNLNENINHIKEIVSMQKSVGGVSIKMEKIKVEELVEAAIKMSGILSHANTIEIYKKYEPGVIFVCDKNRLLQILVNLILNAKDALLEENYHESEKQYIKIKIERTIDRKFISIIVEDNGIGISPENLNKIFSMGFTTKPKGHGFGLNSSAIAAKELGGDIEVTSQGLGKGTTFIIKLPMTCTTAQKTDSVFS